MVWLVEAIEGDKVMQYIILSATVIGPIAAVVAIILMWVQIRRELARYKEQLAGYKGIEKIIAARKPKVESFTPIVLPWKTSFKVIVPIRNSSMSELAAAHRVQVSFTFSSDNVINEVDPGPFRVIGGGEGKYTVTLEANVLPPLSVSYPSVIVKEKEMPQKVSIGWAERTGWQNIPLKSEEI